jgi:hypothetical protein
MAITKTAAGAATATAEHGYNTRNKNKQTNTGEIQQVPVFCKKAQGDSTYGCFSKQHADSTYSPCNSNWHLEAAA